MVGRSTKIRIKLNSNGKEERREELIKMIRECENDPDCLGGGRRIHSGHPLPSQSKIERKQMNRFKSFGSDRI